MTPLDCILLIDDNPADNFLHKLAIRDLGCAKEVAVALHGQEALDLLTTPGPDGRFLQPELVFLDINMPIMNGWEFTEAYAKLPANQRAGAVVIMLTTSVNPDDLERAKDIEVVEHFARKPLKADSLQEVLDHHFPGRFPRR